jgi:endonuclease V-like protein UPF0215 family
MNLNDKPTEELMSLVEQAQQVQKRNPPSSNEWQVASVVINTAAAILAGRKREAYCPECLALWNEENGQFGLGA